MSTETTSLEPTERTTIIRGKKRAILDRGRLHSFLKEAPLAHLGLSRGEHPVVMPVAFAIDAEGPDRGGSLYVHGSVAARWLADATGATVCVTVTELDGLVAGRSAFHHSMNYRSAVVIGAARLVETLDERQRALDLIVDHMIPGRSSELRPSTRKELSATAVMAVPLHETSMKERRGGPADEEADIAAGIWGGHIPVRRVVAGAVPDALARGPVPDSVQRASAPTELSGR